MVELMLLISLALTAMMIAPDHPRASFMWSGLAALGMAIFALGLE
ncbi:UNVERIFIED_ORG: hypothetical protein J2W74_003434 [Methylorubrum zatmanii]